jgi:hypothetical protein
MCFAHKPIVTTLALLVLGVHPALGQDASLLGSARRALVRSDVVFNKDRKFLSDAVPYSLIFRSGLPSVFHIVTTNPDIIIKLHKDVVLIGEETISLTVFDAENNNIVYSEERKLVDEENDVDRLVAHFLAKVKIEKAARAAELAAQVEKEKREKVAELAADVEKAKREKDLAKTERDSEALKNARVIVSIYCSSPSTLQTIIDANRTGPNEYHVFLRDVSTEEEADVVLVERIKQANRVLVLLSRDTKEVLHSEVVQGNSLKHSVTLMSKWITSTPWE